MAAENYIPRTVGNLEASGKEFKILASNVSFELLAKYDNYIRGGGSSVDNSGTSLASSGGIGKNIANSVIVCAPQTKATSITYTYSATYSWIDNGDGIYTNGETIINGSTQGTTTYTSSKNTEDYGKYDLVVTDQNGIPAVITPPFNDIDTKCFTTYVGLSNPDVVPSRKDYCKTTTLTLSDSLRNSVGNADQFISDSSYTFTHITDEGMRLIQVNSGGLGTSTRYYVCKDLGEPDEHGFYSYTYYDSNNDKKHISKEDSKVTRADYAYVLNEMISLREWKEKNFTQDSQGDAGKPWDGWTVNQKVTYLLEHMNDLLSLNFVLRHDTATPSYLWSGKKNDYNKVSQDKNTRENTTFIIQEDNA